MSSGSTFADPRPTVAIVGGGFSGAVCAHQLARRGSGRLRIVVIEPRAELGRGVAYSTEDPAHRINVPAARMTFVPSDACHFDRWLKSDRALREDPEALTPDGRAFPRRAVFGRYAAETIEPYLVSREVEHLCARASSIRRAGVGYAITLDSGETLQAAAVALAATHPSPSPPKALAGLVGDPRFIPDTQGRTALDGVERDDRVLIVGTGLTMADIVASLDARGHRGPIVAASRRGLLSRGHAETPGEYGDFTTDPSQSARELLRRVRATTARAVAEGRPWQHALDGARAQGRAIWAALDDVQRLRLARRLRTFWDVHRFRVAPQVEQVIARLRAEGRFQVLTGESVAAEAGPEALSVEIRLRSGFVVAGAFEAVALATGPAHRDLTRSSRLFSGLAGDGLVRLDPYGLGLATDATSQALGADGRPSPALWIVGPLARGAFGELMGLPEVAKHAELVAGEIARHVRAEAPERSLEVA